MSLTAPQRLCQSFGRSFTSYHSNAAPQAEIAVTLVDRLIQLGAPHRFRCALELGCGTGHLTRALRAQFSLDRLVLNDLTAAARATADRYDACYLQGDLRQLPWPKAPDLIASASTLQWLADPEVTLRRAARALAPGGWLALSSFGANQFVELATLGHAPQAPGLRGAEGLRAALTPLQDVVVMEARQKRQTLWLDSPRAALRHLRATGVNGGSAQQWTKSDLARFSDAYRHHFEHEGRVPLTYHPSWIIARRR